MQTTTHTFTLYVYVANMHALRDVPPGPNRTSSKLFRTYAEARNAVPPPGYRTPYSVTRYLLTPDEGLQSAGFYREDYLFERG